MVSIQVPLVPYYTKTQATGKKHQCALRPKGPKGNCEGVNTGDVYFRKK